MNRVAYGASGERRFLREFQRLDALFGSLPTAQQTNFGLGREKYMSNEDRAFHRKEVEAANSLIDMEPQSMEARADRHARRSLRLLLHPTESGDGRVEASSEIDRAAAIVEQSVHVAK